MAIGVAALLASGVASVAQPMMHHCTSQAAAPRGTVSIAAARIEAVDEGLGKTATIKVSDPNLAVGQVVIVHAEGSPLASAHVVRVEGASALVAFDWVGVLPAGGFEAAVLPASPGRYARPRLPAACFLHCRVGRVAADGATCHVAATEHDGFEVGDRLLVERHGLPIARLILRAFDGTGASAEVVHLVANAAPGAGDTARLEQNPRRRAAGRLRSRVLRVEGKGDQTVWFPASSADGAAVGDRWTVRDGGSYIGVVQVQEFRGPFAVGQALAGFCRRPIRVGDDVMRRDPRDVRAGRLPFQIFRIEGDYALVNAGEEDRVERDQRLLAVRDGRTLATLIVTTVKVDFCGAKLEPTASAPSSDDRLLIGDDVYLAPPPPPRRAIGTIEWVEDAGRVASVALRDGASLRVGEVVAVESGNVTESAGLVTASGRDHATLYLPEAARGGEVVAGAEVFGGE
jgi:hypothetical protein